LAFSKLRNERVVGVVNMFGDVWRRYADEHNHNANAGGERRNGVSDDNINESGVQFKWMSRWDYHFVFHIHIHVSELCAERVVGVDDVHNDLWWRHAVVDAHSHNASGEWRHAVRVTDWLADMQYTGVSW
jgi:hypothetical protein